MLFDSSFSVFEPPFVYFILLGVGLFISIFVFKNFKKSSGDIKKYNGQTLNEVLQGENLSGYMRHFGRKTEKGILIHSMNSTKISSFCKAKFSYKEQAGQNVITKYGDFLIFKTKSSFLENLPIVSKIVKHAEFFIIDNKDEMIFKDKFRDTWTISNDVFIYQLGGIWISSLEGKNFLTEFIYKKIFENIKEEDMNYPKRIVWYDHLAAANMTAAQQIYDLEQAKWKQRVYGETGVKPNNN